MLRQLHVKNYAIIDAVTIDFSQGLNIITGETGAGKSILLGALGLVLGERADLSALYNQDKKCIIEAHFDTVDLDLKSFFTTHELDFESEMILRRELLPSMRSRAFINDTPVKLKTLQLLSQQLINVHRQFATLDIFNRDFQTIILDTLAGQRSFVATYKKSFIAYKNNIQELQQIEQRLAAASRENDFIKFQINEINDIQLDPEQDKTIHGKMKQAENAGEIKLEVAELERILSSGELNLTDLMNAVQHKAQNLVKISSAYQPIYDRLSSIKIELDDIASELDSFVSDQIIDPTDLAELTNRYDSLQRLYFKHQVDDSGALLNLLDEMKTKIQSSTSDEERQTELEELIKSQKQSLEKQAVKISKKRKQVSPDLKTKVESALSELAMSNATFSVQIEKNPTLNSMGYDLVDFVFSANPGSAEQALQQVASGGELSRLSLALKSIIAHELALPTMVFDEIDSGVSGDTALRMGRMLRGLGNSHQTIVITHSPQVAAQGLAHFYVEKEVHNGSTFTGIRELSKKERKEKIAVMLSSDPPTTAAKKNAQELLAIAN